MKRTPALIALLFAAFLTLAPSPADATRCRDGSYSTSSGSGTCSWHGGIDDDTPSVGGGGGYGGGSGNSGIYYGSGAGNDDTPLVDLLGFLALITSPIWGFALWMKIAVAKLDRETEQNRTKD
jgi:hypothetical protein